MAGSCVATEAHKRSSSLTAKDSVKKARQYYDPFGVLTDKAPKLPG
jgi:hypothetical protein